MNDNKSLNHAIADELIMNRIYVLRGKKVMIDEDLALLYHVDVAKIRVLLRKHPERFPEDFQFTLNPQEHGSLQLQDSTVSRVLQNEEFPIALTEQGLSMLSGMIKSDRSVAVNVRIIRIFTLIRQVLPDYPELSKEFAKFSTNMICHK